MKRFTFRPFISLFLCASMLLPMPAITASTENDHKTEQSYYEWTMNGIKKGAQWTWDHKVEVGVALILLCIGGYMYSQSGAPSTSASASHPPATPAISSSATTTEENLNNASALTLRLKQQSFAPIQTRCLDDILNKYSTPTNSTHSLIKNFREALKWDPTFYNDKAISLALNEVLQSEPSSTDIPALLVAVGASALRIQKLLMHHISLNQRQQLFQESKEWTNAMSSNYSPQFTNDQTRRIF